MFFFIYLKLYLETILELKSYLKDETIEKRFITTDKISKVNTKCWKAVFILSFI